MATKKQYKTKDLAIKAGKNILDKLQKRIDNNPKLFCENYGQKEISNFEDCLSDLNYSDKCDVMEMMYRVNEMTPNM